MGQVQATPPEAGTYDPLSGTAQLALWCSCGALALQTVVHWLRAWFIVWGGRAEQHELLCGASTGSLALLYLAVACGLSQDLYAVGAGYFRIFFHLQYAGRALSVGLLLLNLSALAREKRPPAVALVFAWVASVGALYLGNFVNGAQRLAFLGAASLFLLPVASTLLGTMGERLRLSKLHTVYRFLATWCVVCSACYPIVFFVCEVGVLLDTETELLLYGLLDYCTIGVSSLIVSGAGSEVEVGLLPAQEAELSLYPGPHNHGFYPNPDYYDDNL